MENTTMRAKLKVTSVVSQGTPEYPADSVKMTAVCKNSQYPEDGSDEDNTFAKFSPSASFEIYIANPALIGKIKEGQTYYADFTLAEEAPATAE